MTMELILTMLTVKQNNKSTGEGISLDIPLVKADCFEIQIPNQNCFSKDHSVLFISVLSVLFMLCIGFCKLLAHPPA